MGRSYDESLSSLGPRHYICVFIATVVCRPNISVLGVSELLWWGFVEPLHLVNWHSHLGRNTIKYVVCVSANKEPVQNTSLQLDLSMCGLLLVRC